MRVRHVKPEYTRSVMRGVDHGTEHIHGLPKRRIILSHALDVCRTADHRAKHVRRDHGALPAETFTGVGQKSRYRLLLGIDRHIDLVISGIRILSDREAHIVKLYLVKPGVDRRQCDLCQIRPHFLVIRIHPCQPIGIRDIAAVRLSQRTVRMVLRKHRILEADDPRDRVDPMLLQRPHERADIAYIRDTVPHLCDGVRLHLPRDLAVIVLDIDHHGVELCRVDQRDQIVHALAARHGTCHIDPVHRRAVILSGALSALRLCVSG